MPYRLLALSAALLAASFALTAQTKAYTPPKTPWGDPDLQGNWPAQFNIPMQRAGALKDKEVLSDEEFTQTEAKAEQQSENTQKQYEHQITINPPLYWTEGGKRTKQTSVVIDPPDGRIPPLTPQAKQILASERGGLGPGQHFPDKVDSWEDFDYYSRCITRGFPSTMLYTIYNYGNDIIQSPGYVVIRSEMVHEQRIIPIDSGNGGRTHVGKAIKTYMGNSIGHWEGNTLVVETTNLRPESGSGGRYTDAAENRRTLHPHRAGRARMGSHHQRSERVDQTLHAPLPVQARSRLSPVRVRLPRGQLHDAGRAHRGPAAGSEGPGYEGGPGRSRRPASRHALSFFYGFSALMA